MLILNFFALTFPFSSSSHRTSFRWLKRHLYRAISSYYFAVIIDHPECSKLWKNFQGATEFLFNLLSTWLFTLRRLSNHKTYSNGTLEMLPQNIQRSIKSVILSKVVFLSNFFWLFLQDLLPFHDLFWHSVNYKHFTTWDTLNQLGCRAKSVMLWRRL